MSTVEEIEQAIERLTPDQEAELTRWLEERRWAKWDRQIEADSAAGKLDHLIADVEKEIDAGHHGKL